MTTESLKRIEQWQQEIDENRKILKHNKRVLILHKLCMGFVGVSFLIAFYIPVYFLIIKRYFEFFIIIWVVFWFKNFYELTPNNTGAIGKYIHLDKNEAIIEINSGIQNIKKREKFIKILKNGGELSSEDELELKYNVVSSQNITK